MTQDLYKRLERHKEEMREIYLTEDYDEEFEDFLREISVYLAHLIFRNGVVEDLHSGNPSKLTDETMKILNKDVNNRIYTILTLWYNSTDNFKELLLDCMEYIGNNLKSNWDAAQIDENVELELLSRVEVMDKMQNPIV